MNPRVLLIMMFSVDVWVAMFVMHYHPATDRPAWEAKLAAAGKGGGHSAGDLAPLQLWMTGQDQIGFWPDMKKPRSLASVVEHLRQERSRRGRLDVRLLCAAELPLAAWGPAVQALGKVVDEVRVGPLPARTGE